MNESQANRAEKEVKKNTAEFEEAMGHLENAVEDKSQQFQQVVNTVKRPREIVQNIGQGARRYLRQGQNYSQNMLSRARQNPRPFAIGAAVVISGIFLSILYRRRSQLRDVPTIIPGHDIDQRRLA